MAIKRILLLLKHFGPKLFYVLYVKCFKKLVHDQTAHHLKNIPAADGSIQQFRDSFATYYGHIKSIDTKAFKGFKKLTRLGMGFNFDFPGFLKEIFALRY